jgi:hypothetical protein
MDSLIKINKMPKAKYIKTKNREIIVFGEIMLHSDFRNMNPVSAGFISFGINEEGNPTCSCYGESISLRLQSDEEDTFLAQSQLGFRYY